MESLNNEDFRDKLGEFLDEYVYAESANGTVSIPRNIPYFKQAIQVMLKSGWTEKEIRRACLKEKFIIIPNFLFDDVS